MKGYTKAKRSDEACERGRKLLDLIEAGIKAREARFGKTARELELYDLSDRVPWEVSLDSEATWYTKVYKTTQYKREIGSRLMNQRPVFRCDGQPWSTQESLVRAGLMEDYLNYCTGENGFSDNLQYGLDDGLLSGRGVLWFGLHPDKDGVVIAAQDSWKTLVLDPDPKRIDHINWCARIRRKSRKWLAKRIPEKSATIATIATGPDPFTEGRDITTEMAGDTGSELVTFYEVWMRVGLSHYLHRHDDLIMDDAGKAAPVTVDEPRKYIVSADGVLLSEGTWETPYHLDGRWPFLTLDFLPFNESVWPDSPLRPGLPWLRGMNMVSTLMLLKYRKLDGRTIIAVLQGSGIHFTEDDIDAIVNSDRPIEVIQPKLTAVDQSVDVKKYVQSITLESNLQSDMAVFNHLNRMFEVETGLHEFLFTGQPGTQDRSAAATQVRDRNSQNRIDAMRSKMDNFLSQCGRMLALTARFHLDGEDIRPFLGPESAAAWGQLMAVEDLEPEALMERLRSEMGEEVSEEVLTLLAQDTMRTGVSLEEWAAEVDIGVEVGTSMRRTPEARAQFLETANQQFIPELLRAGAYRSAGFWMAELAKEAGASAEDRERIMQDMAMLEQRMQQAQAPAIPQIPGQTTMEGVA